MTTGKPQERDQNVDQLRDHIDSGRTGDKVEVKDPAAAPLGTDDEAGGTPPSAEQVAAATRHERRREGERPGRPSPALWLAVIIMLAMVAAILALL